MRHLKLIGLCLVAVFALAAVAATASASAAEPEWGACVPAKKGHYEDSNCAKEKFTEKKGVKKYSGKYEWKAGAPATTECVAKKHGNYLTSACNTEKEKKGVPEEHKGKYEKIGAKFTAAGGAGVLTTDFTSCVLGAYEGLAPREDCENEADGKRGWFNTAIKPKVECQSEHATGEAAGSDEVANVSVRFTGCTAEGAPATTPGLPAGEIQTSILKGRLGYINKSATPQPEVGVLLEPASAGGQFAEFEVLGGETFEHVGVGKVTPAQCGDGNRLCSGSYYEETGPGVPTGHDGIISPILPINQMTHTFTQDYRIEKTEPYWPNDCQQHGGPDKCVDFFGGAEPANFKNIPSHFEGGPLEALEVWNVEAGEEPLSGSDWESGGEEITNVNTVEGEAEIKG